MNWKCKSCDQSLQHNSRLAQQKIQTIERGSKCNECGKIFQEKPKSGYTKEFPQEGNLTFVVTVAKT
jgi:uncharacterized Zn finger protein